MLTAKRLKEVLYYNPNTGLFIWRISRGRKVMAGQVAGSKFEEYIRIKVDGKNYLAHRLAWLYVNGDWPVNLIDHKNMLGSDNRINNLREASSSQNTANSKSKRATLKGAYRSPYGRWISILRCNNKQFYLGSFDSEIKAHNAYAFAAKLHFGEYARVK